MISTGIDKRIKVQQLIENQLPEFILSESPATVDFLKQYYISQEFTGGSVDLVDNLDQYLKLDNLTPEVIKGNTNLSVGIGTADKIITVTSTKGFPNEYGLLKINDEIITYTGITTNSFTGCQRGFSGITSYRDVNNPSEIIFSSSSAESHAENEKVNNLSSLFLKEFYKKIKNTFTPGLENSDFVSNLDVNNFIKEARTFYESKGTEESFRILFNILFGVDPKIIDLEKYLIKPSSAKFVRRQRIVAEKLSGNPLNLKGQTIFRSTDLSTTAAVSEVEVLSGISGISTSADYFILDLFVGFDDQEFITGTFNVTGKTKVIENVSGGSSVITVDSTVGFGTTGTIISGLSTNITYTNKTVNQFLNCSGIDDAGISLGDDIIENDNIFGYENGNLSNKSELRITGVLNKFIPSEDNRLSLDGETITVKSIGDIIENPLTDKSQKEIFANSWIYNTSSTYDIDEDVNGSKSQFKLKSKIDKSSLKEGDIVEILEKKNTRFPLGTNIGTSIIQEIIENQNEIKLEDQIDFKKSKRYAVRRIIKKAVSSAVPIEFGNNILTSDVQNVYNESDENMYVASGSLPSHIITKNISEIGIPFVIEGTTIQNKNPLTQKYSVISFSSDVPFVTGDRVFYSPQIEDDPLDGLESGFYFIEKVVGVDESGNTIHNKIRLYQAPAFIEANDFIEFDLPKNTIGNHTFTLASQHNKKITTQKLLKKYPLDVQQNLGEDIETLSGPIGMLINGVEIQNGKSEDAIFNGEIDNFSVIGFGTDYDVVNPPLIEIENVSVGSTEALVSPVLVGDIKEIQVDQQDFDIDDVISIKLTGGNSGESVLQPVLRKRNRVLEFSGVTTNFGGGVDTFSETITFSNLHNLVSGQILVYDKNKNTPLGIGEFKGSDLTDTESLVDGQQYWPEVVGLSTIRLYRNENDYVSGINTIGFTNIAKSGTHKFRIKNAKNTLSSVRIIKSGKPYINRKVFVNPTTGISTQKSTITFENHGFSTGEIVNYKPSEGLGITTPQSISGLSTTTKYKILKIDDNVFRVCDVGISGNDNTNFISKKYEILKTKGTGYQLFQYPDIEISVDAIYSAPQSGQIKLTPVIQGQITEGLLYQKGTGYGTTDIINYENTPNIIVKNGISRPGKNINPSLNPIISNGKIVAVNIQDGGDEYHSTPDLTVIGNGVGASLRAVIDRDENSQTYLKIIDVVILNNGIGYDFNSTFIRITERGKNAVFNTSIKKLNIVGIQTFRPFNQRYQDEVLVPTDNQLKYSVVGYSTQIGESEFGQRSGEHSPIIGWAYDGNPIYGPFGYSDPFDNSSTIKILNSGYVINSKIKDRNKLPFELGFFVEDYVFSPSSTTDLDRHNGRFGKTPDYPNGVYAYFASVDSASQEPKFPFFVGNTYRSNPSVVDSSFDITQSFDFNNSKLTRNTFPYKLNDPSADNDFIIESNEIIPQTVNVTSVSKGSVDNLSILKSGDSYKINDSVIFDNSGTGGSGVSAFVNKIDGKEIIDIVTNYELIENVTFVRKDATTLSIFTPNNHQLEIGNNLVISGLTTDIKSITGTALIGRHGVSNIPTESTILYKELPPNYVSGIVTDIFVYKTDIISIGSSIGIGTEKLSVLNKFDDRNILRVERGITGTAHTLSTEVNLIPNFFEIAFKSSFFNSKVDDVVYFNPRQSVGIATTVGISSSINVTVGDITTSVSVPAQSIYLPNHPFKTGQQITLKTDGNSAIQVSKDGSNSPSQTFSVPFIGSSQTLFAINKSPNYIGIVTQVGLITSTNGLFFRSNGDDYFKYRFESNFHKVTGNVERINSRVSLTTAHNLSINDIITLDIDSDRSVGIGTSNAVKVKYNSLIDSLLIDQIDFTSSDINTSTDTITLNSHNLKTGDKVYYDATGAVASGLTTGAYFVYKLDSNNIKLSDTFFDSTSIPPKIINITSSGGSDHQLSLIDPPIEVIRNNNLVFDLSDSSLVGFDFKIYQDNNFKNNFVSTGKTSTNAVTSTGTIGVTPTASLTLNYSNDSVINLFYNVEKSGFISTSDFDVKNALEISYVDSKYNDDYKVVGVGEAFFDIRLNERPEILTYDQNNSSKLKYSTTSETADGPINSLKLVSGGSGYTSIPKFVSVASTEGINAKILPESSKSNKIENVEILNVGFEYPSDKTLRPIANLCPVVSTKNSNEITSVTVKNGGENYLSEPELVIQDVETKEIINSGFLKANISLASQTITSVDVINTPFGIGNCNVFSKNNTSGIPITNIAVGATIITNETVGIVTITLATPILGFSTPPFEAGDKIFVENVENEYGKTFNSPVNNFTFYPVTRIVGSSNPNPFKLEFNIHELVSNPGLAKTIQTFGSVINFKKYPKFIVNTELSKFIIGEKILISRNDESFNDVDLVLNKVTNNYIKLLGTFDLKNEDKIKGSSSGAIATVNSVFKNKGEFKVDFSSEKLLGWSDDVGKLNEDYQVIPDNDYYQSLSYTIQSPIEYQKIVSPVNKLVHTTGLKNFADVGISSSIGVGKSIVVDSSTIIRDLTTENRVDAIDNFDLVKDVDILTNPLRSKFVSFENKRLSNFFECITNKVILIDDISSFFREATNNANTSGSLNISNSFDRFLIQARVPSTGAGTTTNILQATELITSIDFINSDIVTIQKGSIEVESKVVDIIGNDKGDGNFELQFSPTNIFDNDLDIKILQQTFLPGVGVGNSSLGFINLEGKNINVLASTASTIVSSNISDIDSFFATIEVKDSFSNETNIIELYLTHDGTNSFISNYSLETTTNSSIGTFTSNINSNILSLDFENDRSNSVLVRSKIIGFGKTTSGIGTFRFKSEEQADGFENSARLESNFVSIASTGVIAGFTTSKDTTIKSVVRVSIGNTSALHQVLITHDGDDIFITQYPFISIGTESGIGTFSSEYSGTNLNLKFHPDSSFTGIGDLQIQSYNEIINTEMDLINIPQSLNYGKTLESLSLLQYDAINGERSDNLSFTLTNNNNPIFSKFFNPASDVNLSTGEFTLTNNFFNRNERLIYNPGSSIDGVGISSLVMSNGNPLPSEVYVVLPSSTTNSPVLQLSLTRGGSPVTFNSVGSGNRHQLSMFKSNEKSLITLDSVIQSPISFTPVTTTLFDNVSGQVSISTTILSLAGITSVVTNDLLKIDDEIVKVNNVGFGTTNVGPITNTGVLKLVDVSRAVVGTSVSTHTDSSLVRLFKGGYNIVGEKIFFTDPPRGSGIIEKDISNRNPGRASFSGRVFLQQDYSSNAVFDDVSTEFTGIGKTFRTSISGVNTTGLTTGSSFVTLNGIFQPPTTLKNPDNNYEFIESVGITSFVFSGISSTDGTQIISESDINQNQLPRSGQIISIGYSGGLGLAPLAGAAVTAVINPSGTITAVGVGTRDFHGSGYRSELSTTGNGILSIGVIDEVYQHRFTSSSDNSITANTGSQFTPTDADYDSLSGDLILTIPNHGLTNSNTISIATESLIFRCDKDAYSTDHPYPRTTDPAYNTNLSIGSTTINTLTVNVGSGGGVGSGATITATVGIGGTLIFSVVNGGSGYINPKIIPPSPTYENLPVVGVSRIGLGATTDTGIGLLLNINVGGSNTTGIGSTLFEVKGFDVARTGYGFRKGDVFKPVGLITDKSLSSPLSELEFTVNEVFTDSFCSWNVGEFDYIDSIKNLQDGSRTRFPLNFKGELVSFESRDNSDIIMQNLILIFVNGVVQTPGEAYIFDGGTSFEFLEPPDEKDNVVVFFFKGKENVDVVFTESRETVKVGDEIQLLKNANISNVDQNRRVIAGIVTSDLIETNLYFEEGIDSQISKPLRWIKQKTDKFINGELVTKVRPLIEPLIFPESKIIKDFSTSDQDFYLDSIGLGTDSSTTQFFYENPNNIGVLIVDESITPRAASLSAVISVGGTVQSITVNDGGEGYVGTTTSISVGVPTTGINTHAATATGNITNGTMTSVTVTDGGEGYSSSVVTNVIAPVPTTPYELVTGFTGSSGFSGIITGINVLSSSTIKFFLEKESGTFTGLSNGDPIYIFDTAVGTGVTSVVTATGAPVGIGTSFFDNIYLISSYSTTSNTAEFVAGVKTDTSLIGISTSGISGKFSWGKLTGGTRNPVISDRISVTVSGKTINSGLSTFPTIQRRNSGIRNTGALLDKSRPE